MLVFNSWLKDIEMFIKEQKLTNIGSGSIGKGLHLRRCRRCCRVLFRHQFYMEISWIDRALWTSFESGKTFSSLVGDFYSHIQWPRETENQFANELQILGQKVISIRPTWKDEANEALKTQFASRLHGSYLVAMACNLLKTQVQMMNFTQFWAECISMFGSQIKAPIMKTATNSVSSSGALKEQKTRSQKKNSSKDKKIKAQPELIEKQKHEIENLKAAQAIGVSLQELVNAILQAMSCLYVGDKKPLPSNSGKKFVGTPRPPKPSVGVDGSLDNNLTCWYCKDTGHKLDNCKWLQKKLACECAAMQSIATEEWLNPKCHWRRTWLIVIR